MLVSDAIPTAGLGDGTYRFADRVVTVERGVAFLEGTRTLAGSTLCIGDALRRVITVTGLPVGAAVRMSATTAAPLLGLDDRGALPRATAPIWSNSTPSSGR
ncbi:hypothetical protein [Streptomyces malaysiensis]|uniref:Uncharacterized protein n=1 Tax=Streptomyces malaysiensis TaxID=92644 RepID=A0A2J7YQH8_STRMQ|nr:hypothetical protein [Streptomyces malaysiensis]PNG90159.1 hypothetical protein SMF913_25624 [Streptomyces malaysiensis]